MNFYQRCSVFSPALVRLLARNRKHGKAMTNTEIFLRASHLTPFFIESISQCTSWKGIDLDNIRDFTCACNVDLTDTATMRRMYDTLRKDTNFSRLIAHPEWDTYFKPLLIKWRKSYGVVTTTTPAGLWSPLRRLLIRLNPLIKV